MSYGFKVFDSVGNLRLDVSERLGRVIYLNEVASGSVYLPEYSPSNGCHGFLNRQGGFAEGSVTYNTSNNYLTWSSTVAGVVFAIATK
jgi:hypothetical protein